jgi:hypothetical protein
MEYKTEDGELLGLWTAACLLGEAREIKDAVVQEEILTRVEVFLAAFIGGLKPVFSEETGSGKPLNQSWANGELRCWRNRRCRGRAAQ